MLKGVKKFIKQRFINDSHPFLMSLYLDRLERKIRREQEVYSRMTYAEIEEYLGRKYREVFGRPLDWEDPKTYNEKLIVWEVYMPTPLKTRLTDKVAVREWVTEKIGSEYLIPLLGVYETAEEIDFDALPEQFVIKCNHDSGSVTLVKDKSKVNRELMRRKYNILVRRNYAYPAHQMHYRDIERKIIVEQYMGAAVSDYKFQCFNGEPYSCRVDYDRFGDHRRNVYNMDWEIMPFMKGFYKHPEQDCPRPPEYDEMKRIVRELGRDIEQVRIDLYLVDGKIYFGEMTFTNAGGFENFVPDEWDYKFGELWPFDKSIRSQVLAHSSRP